MPMGFSLEINQVIRSVKHFNVTKWLSLQRNMSSIITFKVKKLYQDDIISSKEQTVNTSHFKRSALPWYQNRKAEENKGIGHNISHEHKNSQKNLNKLYLVINKKKHILWPSGCSSF